MPKSRWSPVAALGRKSMAFIAVVTAFLFLLSCGRDDSLRRGKMFVEAGMYSEAVAVLHKAVEAKPNDPGAHLLLGTALLGTGDFLAAEEAFGRATLLNPGLGPEIGDAYFRVASVLLQRSDSYSIQEGSRLLRIAIEKQPKLAGQASQLLTDRAFAMVDADPALAFALLDTAQGINPALAKDEKVQLTLALSAPDSDKKREQLEKFVASFPDSDRLPRAFVELAKCYDTENRRDDAITRLEYVLAHFPNAAEASTAKETLSRITRERDELHQIENERLAGRARDEQLRKEAEHTAAVEQARLTAQEEEARAEAERKRVENERKRQAQEAERVRRKAEWAGLSSEEKQALIAKTGPYAVRAYNADDAARIQVNGTIVIRTGFGEDSGWIDIGEYLHLGANNVTFVVQNDGGAITYGFQLRKGDAIIWKDLCGVARESGCDNNRDMPRGDAYRKEYTLAIE